MNITEIADTVRHTLVELEGKIKISEFYLSDPDGERIEFSMPPEQVRVKTTASFRTFNIIESGEIKTPRGSQLTNIAWRGILPGSPMLLYRFVKTASWEQPDELIKVIRRWRERGTKLRLLITQTPINLDVYIKSVDFTHKGGLGNVEYNIEFIAAKALQVRTVAESDAQRTTDTDAFDLLERQRKKSRTILLATVENIFEAAIALSNGDWQALLERNDLGIGDLDSLDPTIILH